MMDINQTIGMAVAAATISRDENMHDDELSSNNSYIHQNQELPPQFSDMQHVGRNTEASTKVRFRFKHD